VTIKVFSFQVKSPEPWLVPQFKEETKNRGDGTQWGIVGGQGGGTVWYFRVLGRGWDTVGYFRGSGRGHSGVF